MRGWWQCPSGLGSDLRWAGLGLAARGLLATFADAADGHGFVVVGAASLADILRAAAPHDGDEARLAAWGEIARASMAVHDGDVVRLLLPRDGLVTVLGGLPDGAGEDPPEDAPQTAADPRRDRKRLDAWASRYGLDTSEGRAGWVRSAGATRVAGIPASVVAGWVSAAGRKGGRFGHERGANTVPTLADDRSQHGANVGTGSGANSGANGLPPSHSPSEKNAERDGEKARAHGANSGANTSVKDGANVGSAPGANGANEHDLDAIEDALVTRSDGKVDLLSAPASVRMTLRRYLTEMNVTLSLARVMGELARHPTKLWPYMHDARVTLHFLVGKVDNNGQRDARPLSELVAAARAKAVPTPPRQAEARAEAPPPRLAATPRAPDPARVAAAQAALAEARASLSIATPEAPRA